MRPAERRQAIWAALCKRRHDTAANLASEFGVSQRTIWYDIEELMLTHPTRRSERHLLRLPHFPFGNGNAGARRQRRHGRKQRQGRA